MANYIYTAGLNNVGSYQVSGAPYLTSSVVPQSGSGHFKVEFPYVTKQITISNYTSNSHELIRVAFSAEGLEDGVGNYYIISPTKDGNGSTTFDVKATELYVMADSNHAGYVSIFGSLTNLPTSRVDNIAPSGSNWSGSIGVG